MADSYKDLMKKVYSSYTPEEETFAQKQGYSLNPDADNYFGSVYGGIYDSSVAAADNTFSFTKDQIRQAYGGSIDSAKAKYSRDAMAYQDDYQQSLIANNSAMQQAAGAYGSNQSRLAALGLTGSGYNAQIMQSIYGGYQDANSEAYKQQQANKRLMQQVYGDREAAAYNDYVADNRENEATRRAAYIDAEATLNKDVGTAYQGFKQDYAVKQQEYKTNATSIAGYIDDGSADAAYIKQMYDQDYITEDVYKAELARYQTKKAETLAAAVTGAVDDATLATALANVDAAVKNGDMTREAQAKIYYANRLADVNSISSKADYDALLSDIEADKVKLGNYYNSVKSALNAKKTTLDKAETKAKAEKENKKENAGRGAAGSIYTKLTVEGNTVQDAISGNTADAQKYLSLKLTAYGGKTAQQVLDEISNSGRPAVAKAKMRGKLYEEIAREYNATSATVPTVTNMPTPGGGGKKIAVAK